MTTQQINSPEAVGTRALGQLLDENQTAAILNVRVSTLRNWRWRGVGPRFRKLGRMVRYADADVAAFIEGGAA